jgi:hypothetical protein
MDQMAGGLCFSPPETGKDEWLALNQCCKAAIELANDWVLPQCKTPRQSRNDIDHFTRNDRSPSLLSTNTTYLYSLN